MIQATQLRIGNFYDHSGRVKKVTPIVIEALFESERIWCKAIPLTEEWLLRFGFVKKLSNYELENFRFHVNKPSNYDGFLFCEGYSVITDKIHFVHQLQNLYFALTNKELNYESTTI